MSAKNFDFDQTTIPQMYLAYIKDRWNYQTRIDAIPNLYRVMFNSIATFLKYQASKNKPHIGFKLLNDMGEFCFGALLDFHAPEGESDDTGNWTLSFTFTEDDMKDLDDCYDNYSDMFFSVANQEIRSTMFGNFEEHRALTNLYVGMIEVLKQQLDVLCNDGADVEISMPGIFLACVGLEDGQKVYSVIPGHNIKQQIKNDKGLSR